MNFRKVLMKVTGVLAGLLVLVMIGLMVYQNHLIKKANQEAAMDNEPAVETGAAGETGTSGDTDADNEELQKQRSEFQKKMLEDPAVREMIQSGLEAQYEPLFELLALSPEQQDQLKEILLNSAMSYIELNPEILAAATDVEKEMLQKRYDYLREETQLRIEGLLGTDAYEKYKRYEDRSFSRTVVSGFSESLAPEERLTGDQEKELIEVMYTEAQNVYEEIGYDPSNRLEFPSDMDTETISERMEITDRVLFNSADNSWSILSESQLKAYKDYLRNYSEQVEMSLVMMRQEYGE